MRENKVQINEPLLHPIEASALQARRERVFLVIAGLFLGSLTMLNILGITRFIVLASLNFAPDGSWQWQWGQWAQPGGWSFALAVGVLPYPITFLCTDIISEFYGRRRANWLVFVGLILNIWVITILWLGGLLPQQPKIDADTGLPAIQALQPSAEPLIPANATPQEVAEKKRALLQDMDNQGFFFYRVQALTFGAVIASMCAYLAAQLCDVWLFHFWKRLTRGKHLWLRNNGSTLVSQIVDTVAVILITHYYAHALPPPPEGRSITEHLLALMATGYVFKMIAALLDTPFFYAAVYGLRSYLQYDPLTEEAAESKFS